MHQRLVDWDFIRPIFYLWLRQRRFDRAQLPYKSCAEKLCDRPVWTTWRYQPRSDAKRAPEGQQIASAATRAEHRGDSTKQHNGKDREGCDRGAGGSSIRGAARFFFSLPCSLRCLLFGLIHALLRLLWADVVLGGDQLVQA